MRTPNDGEYDAIIIGAGISGMGAALELQRSGFKVCVLEKNERVGGRMTTDRVSGFAIDRGVTIFGSQFRQMRRLMKELELQPLQEWFPFSFGLQDQERQTQISRTRLDKLLLSRDLSFKTKVAMARFTFDVLRLNRKLNHGHSAAVAHLDTETTQEYMERIGGLEFLEKVLQPGLNGPFGGALNSNSKLILFQTFWNILLLSTWAVKGGMDQILEGMAKPLKVVKNCQVQKVQLGRRCTVTALVDGVPITFTSRGVITAVPGHFVPTLCADLPHDISELLKATTYSTLTSAHVALKLPTTTKITALGMAKGFAYGHEIELEHNRVAGMCPPGQGMASIYFWDDALSRGSSRTDAEVEALARDIIGNCFPECRDQISNVHILRWKEGIARFPTGRLAAMIRLRLRIASWSLPLQLCGDYMDGISSEGALVTGKEAAVNLRRFLQGTT